MSTNADPAKVLIVDDEVVIATDLEDRFKKMGYSVCGKATTAPTALELTARHLPDLVIMDIALEGPMDGIEAAGKIRDRWGIPVVFLTAYDDTSRLEKAKLAYPFGYLLKPVKDKDLKVTAEMALYAARVNRQRDLAEKSLEEYKKVVEHSNEMIAVIDEKHQFTMVNQTFLRQKNMTSETIIGRHASEILGPEFFEKEIKPHLDRCFQGEHVEFELNHQDSGGRRVLLVRYFPIFDHDEKIDRVGCIITDTTESRKAQRELEQLSRQRQLALNAADMGWWHYDPITREASWDERYKKIFGVRGTQSPNEEILKLLHPDDLPKVWAEVEAALDPANPKPYATEYRINRADGSMRWVEARGLAIFEGEGPERQATDFVGTVRDITENKRADEERLKLQTQLHQAQKLEAVGTLAGGIAHDFNNLLQTINGYCQMLIMEKTKEDPELSSLQAIKNAGIRAAGLVRQLLAFSRKIDTEFKMVDMNREVLQAVKNLGRTMPKRIRIETRLEDGLGTVKADPLQLEQVMLNLGKNAADAMPEGGELVFKTEQVTLVEEFTRRHLGAQPGPYVLMTVSDTGHGMDQATLEKIFEPFFTTKEVGQGTGLGLASVYGIVKGHGGFITCSSQVGLGTTFKVFFPILKRLDTSDIRHRLSEPIPTGTETVLIVDDEPAVRDFSSKALKKFGYTVLVASSGEEAIELFSSRPNAIDLVILDIGMPGMGGAKALREIIGFAPSAKILVASGYSSNDEIQKALTEGAMSFVEKPYQLTDLMNKIRMVLDHGE